jgi:hypothetical protein
MHTKKFPLIFIFVLLSQTVSGFDNRFFPCRSLYLTLPDKTKSFFSVYSSFGFTEHAYSTVDREINIFDLYGTLDLGVLGRSIEKATGTNPLRSYFYDKSIPFITNGALRIQEVGLKLYYQIIDQCGIGLDFNLSNQQNWYSFSLDILNFLHTPDMKSELETIRKDIFKQLGFMQESGSNIGINDMDLFFRFGSIWDYTLKCRRINAGLRIGALIPMGIKRDIKKPFLTLNSNSDTFGFYTALDCLFELKENFKLGIFGGISKRLKKEVTERIPLLTEPSIFGATSGQVTIKPGYSILLTPYFLFEHMRSGIGFGLSYSLNYHAKDRWEIPATIPYLPETKDTIENLSNWASDYVGLQVFYDFNRNGYDNLKSLLFKAEWSIPTSFFVTKRVAKTHKVSLSIEYNF